MSEAITSTEAPAAQVTPVAPATPEPTPESVRNLAPSVRDALLFGGIETPQSENKTADITPAGAAPVVTETPSTPVETPAPETPVAVATDMPAETPAAAVDDDDITKNFRIHTDDPKQSAFLKAYKAALKVNPNVNPADVAKLVGIAAPESAAAPVEIPGVVTIPQDIATARAQVAQLRERLTQAKAEAKEGKLMDDVIIQLTEDFADKRAELSEIETSHRIAAAFDSQAKQTQNATAAQAEMAKVLEQFPTANDSNSLLGAEIDRQFSAVERDQNHPDRALLGQPGGRAAFTAKCAADMKARLITTIGLTEAQADAAVKGKPIAEAKGPAAVPPAKQTPPQTPTVPRTVLVTNPGGRPAPENPSLDAKQIRERAKNDPAFRDAALGYTAKRVI